MISLVIAQIACLPLTVSKRVGFSIRADEDALQLVKKVDTIRWQIGG